MLYEVGLNQDYVTIACFLIDKKVTKTDKIYVLIKLEYINPYQMNTFITVAIQLTTPWLKKENN